MGKKHSMLGRVKMGDLSKNLSRAEFKCNCGICDYDTVDYELVNVIQDVREQFNASVTVTSGNRCPEYNNRVGGAKKSYHPRGRAADIQVKQVDPSIVQKYLLHKYPDQYGIGKYSSFTHIDTRTNKARWG